jgi:hypothetical protein
MPAILITECMQEISSFNPVPSDYDYFAIQRGEELFRQRGLNTSMGGALAVFEARDDVQVIPTYAARSGSAGLLSSAGWRRLSGELLDAVAQRIDEADAVYFSLHGRSWFPSTCTASSPTGCCARWMGWRSTTPIRMSTSPTPACARRGCCWTLSTAISIR